MSEGRLYQMKQEKDEYCRFCSYGLNTKTQKTLARCPNCGEPYYEQ